MEGALRDLLSVRAVDLRPFEFKPESIDFNPIGLATSIPDFEIHSQQTYIWHAPAGFLPITKSEIIRFGMDSPSGFHLILSERNFHSDCQSVETFEFKLVGPERISKWVGEAILSGDLVASAVNNLPPIEKNDSVAGAPETHAIRALPSKIDLASWTNQRGMEGPPSSPVLLEARLWSVSGDLRGPNGDREKGEWTILEDPWSQRISIVGDSEKMQRAPILRNIEPPGENWLEEERINEEITKLVEERRRGHSGETNISGTVRSMLLEKWNLDLETASIEESKTLIPGWIIHLEADKILHGRNGRLYDLVPLK